MTADDPHWRDSTSPVITRTPGAKQPADTRTSTHHQDGTTTHTRSPPLKNLLKGAIITVLTATSLAACGGSSTSSLRSYDCAKISKSSNALDAAVTAQIHTSKGTTAREKDAGAVLAQADIDCTSLSNTATPLPRIVAAFNAKGASALSALTTSTQTTTTTTTTATQTTTTASTPTTTTTTQTTPAKTTSSSGNFTVAHTVALLRKTFAAHGYTVATHMFRGDGTVGFNVATPGTPVFIAVVVFPTIGQAASAESNLNPAKEAWQRLGRILLYTYNAGTTDSAAVLAAEELVSGQ